MVIPVKEPFSNELMVNRLKPDFEAISFCVNPMRLR